MSLARVEVQAVRKQASAEDVSLSSARKSQSIDDTAVKDLVFKNY